MLVASYIVNSRFLIPGIGLNWSGVITWTAMSYPGLKSSEISTSPRARRASSILYPWVEYPYAFPIDFSWDAQSSLITRPPHRPAGTP